MSLHQKQEQLLTHLGAMKNSQERFADVVRRGREYGGLNDSLKNKAHLLEGCMAKVWFDAQFADGKCFFQADSDSLVVKGITALLCEFYSGETPQDILNHGPLLLEKIGITQHLTPNRRNSLSRIWQEVHNFAACQCEPGKTRID